VRKPCRRLDSFLNNSIAVEVRVELAFSPASKPFVFCSESAFGRRQSRCRTSFGKL